MTKPKTTTIAGIELEIEVPVIAKKLHWRDVPFYKFSLHLHPFMLLECGHTVVTEVRFGKSQDKEWCEILYDRDYVTAKMSYILKPMRISDEKLATILAIALGES